MIKSLKVILLSSILFCFASLSFAKNVQLLPQALKSGDTVGLISSGFRADDNMEIQYATERLEALGLHVLKGKAITHQDGYFAGSDKARAADINYMFKNPKVKAIFEVRGGWGSQRILKYIDYEAIKTNPKIIIGFSDITSLLLAIQEKTGLVTFHGPLAGAFPWPEFTVVDLVDVLFKGQKVTFENPKVKEDDLTQTAYRTETINIGTATGPIIGGNLTVLTSMLDSEYLPSFNGKILFVEDVGEDVYKIDRMLTQLQQAGILKQLAGFVFGTCTNCTAKTPYGSYHLDEVIKQHIGPLKIPAYMGAMIGHQAINFTIPEGVKVKMDADKGTITMLQPAVRKV